MNEFVALVALGVLLVGLGVLAAAYLLTAVGWLVIRGVRRGDEADIRPSRGGQGPPGD
jgi:hypothetical protein